MLHWVPELHFVFNRYALGYRPRHLQPLGNHGGFSGARLWRVESPLGTWCLRAWPVGKNPTSAQLRFIHDLCGHLVERGLRYVAAPVRTREGDTFVEHAGRFWQLEAWLPGSADFSANPSERRLDAAMRAIAHLHLAAATFTGTSPSGHSGSMSRRLDELRRFLLGPAADDLQRRIPDGRWKEMDTLATRMIRAIRRLTAGLEPLLERPLPLVPLQSVVRDVWHDHVLFVDDRVTGIVDFGSAGIDSVSVDVARLLGSLVGDDVSRWRHGLSVYTAQRPLSPEEQELVWLADMTGCFTGGLVWLRWHYLKRIQFENATGMLHRVRHFLRRLESIQPIDLIPGKPASVPVESWPVEPA